MLTPEEQSQAIAEMMQWLVNLTEALRRMGNLPQSQALWIAQNCDQLAALLEGVTGDDLPVGLATALHTQAVLLRSEAPDMPG